MGYRFTEHKKRFLEALVRHFPLLFAIHLPEGFLTLFQQFLESSFPESPKIVFLLLYPLLCFSAVLCSGLSFLTIKTPENIQPTIYWLWNNSKPHLYSLALASLALGSIMIPATLALVLPGLYILTVYIFVPFLILEGPRRSLSGYFFHSKTMAKKHLNICFLTALVSFIVSLIPFFGLSMLDSPLLNSGLGLALEAILGMLLSVLLNTWVSTLFLEVSTE